MHTIGTNKKPIVKSKRSIAVSSILIDRGAPGYRSSVIASSKMDVESVASLLAREDVFLSIKDTLLNADDLTLKAESFIPSKQGVIKTKTTWFTSESMVKSVAAGMSGDPIVKVALLAQILIELFSSLGMVADGRVMRVMSYRDSLFPTMNTLTHELRKMIIAQALDKLKFAIPASNNRAEISVGVLSTLLSPILIDFSTDLNRVETAELELEDVLYLVRAYLTQDSTIFQDAAEADILNDETLKILAHNYSIASLAISQPARRPRRALPFWEGMLIRTKAHLSGMDRFKWERADVVKNFFSHQTVTDGKGRLAGLISFKNMKFDTSMQAVYPISIAKNMTVLNSRADILGEMVSRVTNNLAPTVSGEFLANQIWSLVSNIAGFTGEPMAVSFNMTREELEHYAATTCGRISVATVVVNEVESTSFVFEIDAAGLPYFPRQEQVDSKYITLDPEEAILLSAPEGYMGSGSLEPKSSKIPGEFMGDIFLHETSDDTLFTDAIDRKLSIGIKFRSKTLKTSVDLLTALGLNSMAGSRFIVQHDLRLQLHEFIAVIRELYKTPELGTGWAEALDLDVGILRKIVAQVVDNVFMPVHTSHAVQELAETLFHEVTKQATAADQKLVRNALEKAMTNMELRLEAMRLVLVRSGLVDLDDADFVLDLYKNEGLLDNHSLSTYKVR